MKKLVWLLIVIFVFHLCACSSPENTGDIAHHSGALSQSNSADTPEFTDESAINDAPPDYSTSDEPVKGSETQWVGQGELWITPWDYESWPSDSTGPYIEYTGGEITLPFFVKTTGNLGEKGIGLLIFIDGQPQPYKTETEPEYAYLHTFYSTDSNPLFNLIFTPITGQSGDFSEIYISSLVYPAYSLKDGNCGLVQTSNSVAACFRIRYLQTPPTEDFPDKLPWLTNVNISSNVTASADIFNWTEADLLENIDYRFRINGQQNIIPGITSETPIDLQYEVWGSPYVNYRLVFFVDHIPVTQGDYAPLDIHIQQGKTTTIMAQLQLSQFDGESLVYAILVPRNYMSSDILTRAFLRSSPPQYLLTQTIS
jgi:hypothetical protein